MVSENLGGAASAGKPVERGATVLVSGWLRRGRGQRACLDQEASDASPRLLLPAGVFIYQHRVRRSSSKWPWSSSRSAGSARNRAIPTSWCTPSPIQAGDYVGMCFRSSGPTCATPRGRSDYETFGLVVDLMNRGVHREPCGLARIARLAYSMNMKGKQRRMALDEILDRILRGHTPDTPGRSEDMVRSPWRHGELGGKKRPSRSAQALRSNKSA